MNVLVVVADLGLRALWESVLEDHGHRILVVAGDILAWEEAQTPRLDLAIVELTTAHPEAMDLCRRLRHHLPHGRPELVVLVQESEATSLLQTLRTSPDDVVLGHPDRRTVMSHLAALERRHHVARPALPTAHELALGCDRPVAIEAAGDAQPAWVEPAMVPVVECRPLPSLPAALSPATILLIEDEPRVRRPLRLALQHAGYRVLEASDGEEGLEIIARCGDDIAVVVTDQTMTPVSGLEVLQQVRRRPRRLPVVLMSGYPSLEPPDGDGGPDACLRKPFELTDLARTVQRLAGGEPSAGAA